MKEQFAKFRTQNDIPSAKLLLNADLLELPFVKELVEEDDCRVPLTKERWSLVTDMLPGAVLAHKKKIETDFVMTVKTAREVAFEASKSGDERRLYLDNSSTDADRMWAVQDDEDCIPARLLSATSLFKRSSNSGCKQLDAYSELLREMARKPLGCKIDSRSVWCKGNYETSSGIVSTALCLLERLRLPYDANMAYMLACGMCFYCLNCHEGPGSRAMTWTQLAR